MQDFRGLEVWKAAHDLALITYRLTFQLPDTERYGLRSQLRRAAVSIPCNIAEGCGRQGGLDFARFLHMAMGSACELEYQLLLARDLALLDETLYREIAPLVVRLKRRLGALIRRVRGADLPARATAPSASKPERGDPPARG